MNDRTRLEKRLQRNAASILSDDEVKILMSEARRVFEPHFFLFPGFEDVVRWGSLKARCEQARAERGIDVKSAAVKAGIPRYRVEAIESGQLRELRADLAWRYFDFLGICPWVKKWVRTNSDLAARAGIGTSAGIGGRKSNTAIQRTVPRVTALAEKRKVRATRPHR